MELKFTLVLWELIKMMKIIMYLLTIFFYLFLTISTIFITVLPTLLESSYAGPSQNAFCILYPDICDAAIKESKNPLYF
uniref:Uncharacterized protein n=1 Tax=Parastrongyloides trichosuri TaxID=131310 RepID=A0A0N5A403_PARTI